MSEQQHEFSNSSLFTRMHCTAPLLTRVHCVTNVTPTFRVDSSEKGLIVVMFCSDLSVKNCEGDRA